MPTQASNLTALRAGGSFSLVYLSIYIGTEVLNATLTAPSSYPTKNWTISVNSGSAANVKAGFRVDVYSSGGSFKGRTRIRYAGTISSTNLPVREMSSGYITLATGDIVKVYNDVRLSDKLITATKDFNPDDLSYSDQGSNPPPLPTSGGAWAGWDTMLPIPMTGSNSALVDPDSVTAVTHSWTFPAGLTGSATNVADPNITAATAAEYLVTHVVTDPDNSKTSTQYVPIIVHDASNPPYNVLLEDYSGDETNGYTARVRWMQDTATLTAIPDGAFCVLWKEEYINGTRQSFGQKSSGRSHVLLTGYIRREEGSFEGQSGVESLTFEIISPLARMGELIGYSKVMTSDGSPDKWSELKTLKVKRAIIQLWQFYTNASEAGFDLVFASNFSNATYPQYFIQKSTPLGQMREVADGRKGRLICDRSGRFEVHTKPELYAIGSRSGATQTINLTTADIIDWQYTRDHWRLIEMIEARGFIAGANPAPIFSRWPGLAPGVGNQNTTVERLIEDSQSTLNISAGQLGAAQDGIYVDANGLIQQALDLELKLPPGYLVADFYDEYVAITLTTAIRGLDLSGQLFVLRSVSLDQDDNGAWFVRWTLRTATNGAAGATYTPPTEDTNGLPAFPSIDLVFPTPIEPVSTIVTGATSPARIWGLDLDAAYAWYATEIDTITGAINAVGNSTGLSGTPQWGCSDPFNYSRRYALTTAGLYKNEDLFGGSAWTLVASANTIVPGISGGVFVGGYVTMSINLQGWICVCFGSYSISVSFDYGASWTPVCLHPSFPIVPVESTGVANTCRVEASSYNPSSGSSGVVYAATGFPGGGATTQDDLGRSTDWGLTWSVTPLAITAVNGPGALHVPYRKPGGATNTNSTTTQKVFVASPSYVARTNAISSADFITNNANYVHVNSPRPITAYTNDSNYLWMVGLDPNTSNNKLLYRSTDGGETWTQSGIMVTRGVAMGMCVNGYPTNRNFALFWCRSGGTALVPGFIVISLDGATPIELSDPGLTAKRNSAYVEADISDLSLRG